ncbi:glutathione S-transferase rho [Amia ocellicauda]|uniref:glutathione S-transferase rho n=1 Tax=Amia ocellicauda TaxID=2972642 RepID=UPI0034646AB0
MAKDMFLYWGSGSPPCWRVMIALEEKHLQGYQHEMLSFEKQEHKSKEVLEINPRGQLPSFKHGNIILNESYGACMFLENQFKSQGTVLIPEGAGEQALVYQRMFENLTLQQKMADVIYYTWRIPEAERHESALKRHKEALATEFQLWEEYFQKMDAGSYVSGKNFTMADVMVFPQIAFAFRIGLSQEKYPKLTDYYNLLKDRPSVQASWPPHWKENPQGMDTLKEL